MRIRKALAGDAPGIAKVKIDTWRSAYAAILPEQYLADLSYDEATERWQVKVSKPQPGAFCHVATTDRNRVVGFVAAGPEREGNRGYGGEVYALYVLPEHQRRGIGQSLVNAAVEHLRMNGLRSMCLWVLAENPTRRFYERLGGVPVTRREITVGGVTLEQVLYGWTDLSRLFPLANGRTKDVEA